MILPALGEETRKLIYHYNNENEKVGYRGNVSVDSFNTETRVKKSFN